MVVVSVKLLSGLKETNTDFRKETGHEQLTSVSGQDTLLTHPTSPSVDSSLYNNVTLFPPLPQTHNTAVAKGLCH